MKRKILSTLLALCMALTLLPVQALAVAADYTTGKDTAVQKAASLLTADSGGLDGEGTAETPYLIRSDADLKLFRDIVNGYDGQPQNTAACARLEADIVLNDGTFNDAGQYTPVESGKAPYPWEPIGTKDKPYTGTFDGNGKTISGLKVGNATSAGLFGYTNGATIRNMAVSGYVTGKTYAGGIVGHATDGSIEGCVSLCRVSPDGSGGGDVYAGGIVGYYYTTATNSIAVKNCANLRKISASASGSGSCHVGGIVGQIAQCQVRNCYNVGDVTGTAPITANVASIAGSGVPPALVQEACWLTGTAGKVTGPGVTSMNVFDMSKAEFANGTALSKLQGSGAWEKTGYIAAVGMYLPLLSWQTPDTPDITGSGTKDDPYLIYTAEGLDAFRKEVDKSVTVNRAHAKLMADIVLNDGTFDENGNYTKGASGKDAKKWTPINGYFVESFDGNGCTISGLYVNGGDSGRNAGLFSCIVGGAVKNVAVTGYVRGTVRAGGIAGYATGGSIEGCVNLCRVSASGSGYESGYAGGIVGLLDPSGNDPDSSIRNCANWGAISASDGLDDNAHAGGIAGGAGLDSEFTIANCYSVGMVSSDSAIHGICGSADTSNSYYLTKTVENDPTGFDPYRKEKDDFANGNVLTWLQDGDPSVWTKTGYVAAVDMIVPLLSWQKADTFPINTADDLKEFREMVNGGIAGLCGKLMANIDLGSETWEPIGNADNPYSGTFDGNGKTISGLNVTGGDYAGLFGYTEGATIRNMAVSGTVKGTKYAGGIVGYAKGGTIEGCVNQCLVSASGSEAYAGGIVGYLTDGSAVKNCANLKAISADGSKAYAGGIAGYMVEMNNRRPEISSCYNVGSITGTTKTGTVRTGSIAGCANYSKITNCRWLLGTAEQIARDFSSDDDNMKYAKSRAQFADGTELDSLKGGNPDSPWTKTGYLAAAGMTVPLLDWQTADDHTHNTDGVLGGCTCGLLPEGKGAKADAPYEIKDADDLKAFRDLVNCDKFSNSFEKARCARLTNDIVLNDGAFDEKGNYTKGASGNDAEMWEPIDTYTGTFDGDGHTIKGLYVTPKEGMIRGLFAVVRDGTIQNVTVTGYVSAKTAVGGIVGEVSATDKSVTIKNCVNHCTVRSTGGSDAGGIVGNLYEGTLEISDCANYGTVISDRSSAGGIVGYCPFDEENKISFQRCLNTGRVEGASSSGGIAGYINAESSLTDCFNTGAVTGTNSDALTGGIVGSFGRCTAAMEYCYSVGAASGGLIGSLFDNNALTATNCYWLEGTADKGIIGKPSQETDVSAKTKTQFADGTVLKLLVNKRADSPWADECQYFVAAGMILPVFKGYSHTHSGGTATCKDKAVCEVCGAEYGALDPDDHVGGTELKNAKAATCTEKGYTGDTCCKGCGTKLSNGKDIPSAGHSLKHVPAKAATRQAEGNIEYWYCDGCGKYFSDQAASKEIAKADTVVAKKSGSGGSSGSAAEKTVKSGSTGDAGIALYGVMALLSLTGGAWLTGRKRK